MTDLIDTVQLQETDDAVIHLFDVRLPSGTVVYLTNGLEGGATNIYFPQKTLDDDSSSATYNKYPLKEYLAIPIEISGIAAEASGPMARPTLSVANIPVLARTLVSDGDGTADETLMENIISAEGIESNVDLLDSRITYRKTLLSYAYASTDTAPSTPPVEFPTETYLIDRVGQENQLSVQFELASPFDIEGVVVPGRIVVGKYCPWRYQGYSISRDGGCNWPLNSNGRFYDINNDVITKNIGVIATYSASNTYSLGATVKTIVSSHTKIWKALRTVPTSRPPETSGAYWERLDVCSKTIRGCKVRFQGNATDDILDTSFALPFGGFPGTKKFK